jgi:hypothetical protein
MMRTRFKSRSAGLQPCPGSPEGLRYHFEAGSKDTDA